MKTPCELVVWHVLPRIRKELARELIIKHGLTQARAARLLGVSEPAISNYMGSKDIDDERFPDDASHREFKKQIGEAAQSIIDGSDVVTETSHLCEMVKRSNWLIVHYRSLSVEKILSVDVGTANLP
jgi:predicted transcriptional regulator